MALKEPKTSLHQKILLVFSSLVIIFLTLEIIMRLSGWMFFYFQDRRNQQSLKERANIVILCIGESTTALGGEDAYPSQLERILNDHYGQKKFSVINKGMPAQTTNEILWALPDYLDQYKPDYVLAMIGINDVILDSMIMDTRWNRFKWTVLERLRTYKLMKWIVSSAKIFVNQKVLSKLHKEEMVTLPEVDGVFAHDDASVFESIETFQRKSEAPRRSVERKFEDLEKKYTNAYITFDSDESYRLWLKRIRLKEYHPLTIRNLNKIVRLTTQKGIKFIFAQYPLRKINILQKAIYQPGVRYISSYGTYAEAMTKYNYDDIFTDRFAYDFGHNTALGNELLAENIAKNLLIIMSGRAK